MASNHHDSSGDAFLSGISLVGPIMKIIAESVFILHYMAISVRNFNLRGYNNISCSGIILLV